MAFKEKGKTAIVVGAGVGGVAAAARLAKSGYSVTVLEKNSFTGGRCSLITKDGFRHDQGPSLLLLPQLFNETFNDLGTSLSAEGVELLKCEPNYNIWFGDGEKFELSSDTAVMKREIEKWEGKDGFERYLAWLGEAHRHYEISVREVLHKNFTSIFNLLRPSFVVNLFRLHPFETIYSRASKYFWTDRLRRVFTFGSMYMGMSPMAAPGTYSLLQYTELTEGIWYPVGGFHSVVAALEIVCARLGVELRLSSPVSKILTDQGGRAVTGVQLASGEQLFSDLVLVNADLVYAYSHLLPPKPASTAKSLQNRESSCSSISFYWSLSAQVPELQVHNIFLADEYRESFDAIFNRQTIPAEPSFYVNVPSRIDPTAAPPGKDSIVVLVPVGHLTQSINSSPGTEVQEQDWPAIVSRTRAQVIQTIQKRTNCADLAPLILNESVNTPTSWEETFNLDKGSILGLSHSFFNVLAFRPKTKHPKVAGVYFVGASTHPGTGVPIVLAGAKITTEQILKDRGVRVPWEENDVLRRNGGRTGKAVSELDIPRNNEATYIRLGFFVLALIISLFSMAFIKSNYVLSSPSTLSAMKIIRGRSTRDRKFVTRNLVVT
ncbi:Phytoene desaturase [Podosphaera aphanis]|nr:Phytoene desaturase [Podosphaera aphanis]